MKQLGFKNSVLIAAILFLFGTIALLFFTPRTEVFQLCVVYFSLFVALIAMYHEVNKIRTAAIIGIFARCIAWLAFPTLSDDIYRFIWDGTMILHESNPYLTTPTEFVQSNAFTPFKQLYPLLNSPDYYSVYPTVIQFFSAFGALASNDVYLSSLLIKLPILLAEIGTIWMLPKVLMRLNISPKYSIIYMLNPLIIIDVVGNAHFEAVMIFFIVLSVKLIQDNKATMAGAAMALAIGTKLIPLLMIPFIVKALPKTDRWKFILALLGGTFILFIPLFSPELIEHYFSSIRLYFQTFEFNASLYYIARFFLELILGYNPISILGPLFALASACVLVYLFFQQKSLDLKEALRSSYWGIFCYFLLATTVHPWYIAILVILGLMIRNFSALVWSLLIIFSYSAYSREPYMENPVLLIIEYGVLAYFLVNQKPMKRLFSSAIQ